MRTKIDRSIVLDDMDSAPMWEPHRPRANRRPRRSEMRD